MNRSISAQYSSTIHPLEHAVRITFNSSDTQSRTGSPSVKAIQANAIFKRAILIPDADGSYPDESESYHPQFWFVKLVVPKGLPLDSGASIDRVKLKPGGRQFGSDSCKSALNEISSASLMFCHYTWLEDPNVVVSRRWDPEYYAPWVDAAQFLRRVCGDFMSRFISNTGYLAERNSWTWSGEPAALLADRPKIVQIYISYTFQCAMVLLARHPGHMIRDIGEDNMTTVVDQRMKDLRGWVYDQRAGAAR